MEPKSRFLAKVILEQVSQSLLPLKFENVAIVWQPLVTDKAEHVALDLHNGEIKAEWINGCAHAILEVIAKDKLEAAKIATLRTQQALDVLFLRMPVPPVGIATVRFKTPKPTGYVLLKSMNNAECRVVEYFREIELTGVENEDVQKQFVQFNDKVIAWFVQKCITAAKWPSENATEVHKALMRSLEWRRRGVDAENLVTKFLFRWIALEAILLEPKAQRKRQKVVERLHHLLNLHGTREIDATNIKAIWNLRGDIVHEAAGGMLDEERLKEIAVYIRWLDYTYLISMIFVLENMDKDQTLRGLWKILSSYKPLGQLPLKRLPFVGYVLELWSFVDDDGKREFRITGALSQY